MKLVAGGLNNELLESLLIENMDSCSRVRAAVAYAHIDNMKLFHACERSLKPLQFYCRYDASVAVHPEVLAWFINLRSANLQCKLVPDILHSKVIWWVDSGAYLGSANLTDRAWFGNIEAGVYLSHDDLLESGMEESLRDFFERVDDRSHALTEEVQREQQRIWEQRQSLFVQQSRLEQQFEQQRLLPRLQGLAHVRKKRSIEARFQAFEKEWNETLQIMRSIGEKVSRAENRPAWIHEDVPTGVQADQFLHAYYYKEVRDGARHPYEEFHQRHVGNPELALRGAMAWWKASRFDYSDEQRHIEHWAPGLREYMARDRIRALSEEEFIDAISRVHAIINHAIKRENAHLGLPSAPQQFDDKVRKFGEVLWRARSPAGRTALETFEYVIWGSGRVAERIWKSARSDEWRIPHLGFSSLGELVGWARPDIFPPRNARTSKALRALGFPVSVGL
ncbi:MAG: phospholipase D-like domain-containing protein [Lysobacterales bacterium]|nr:phospholipase [Rhodanobacteraceae bacterium]